MRFTHVTAAADQFVSLLPEVRKAHPLIRTELMVNY